MDEPSDAELVDAAAGTYNAAATPLVTDFGKSIVAFLTARPSDGLPIIAIEGTHDPLGWAIDFLALPVGAHATTMHPTLGRLHAGFYAAAQAIIPKIAIATAGRPWAITGHSLGAALALLVGAMMAEDDHPPIKIGAFAPPRVGMASFVGAIAAIPTSAYRFGNDPVPEVPFTLPPEFAYAQVPLIAVGTAMLPPWRCHAIENYVTAVKGHLC